MLIHECESTTGMRLWKRTREGMNRERGVDTGCEKSGEAPGELFLVVLIGHDRRELFRRRTGPGPAVDRGSQSVESVGRSERSAISHGLMNSGAASSVDIHGSSSNACVRRRRAALEGVFERVLEAMGVYVWKCASVWSERGGKRTRRTGEGDGWNGDASLCECGWDERTIVDYGWGIREKEIYRAWGRR